MSAFFIFRARDFSVISVGDAVRDAIKHAKLRAGAHLCFKLKHSADMEGERGEGNRGPVDWTRNQV